MYACAIQRMCTHMCMYSVLVIGIGVVAIKCTTRTISLITITVTLSIALIRRLSLSISSITLLFVDSVLVRDIALVWMSGNGGV